MPKCGNTRQTTTFSDPRPAARVIEPNVIKDFAAHNSVIAPIVNNGFVYVSVVVTWSTTTYTVIRCSPHYHFIQRNDGEITPAPHQLDLHKTGQKKMANHSKTTMGWTNDEPNCTGLTKEEEG